MLADPERKDHVAHLRVGRLLLGDELQISRGDAAVVAVLREKTASDRLHIKSRRCRIRQTTRHQQAQILLLRKHRYRVFVGFRRDDNLGKNLRDRFG